MRVTTKIILDVSPDLKTQWMAEAKRLGITQVELFRKMWAAFKKRKK